MLLITDHLELNVAAQAAYRIVHIEDQADTLEDTTIGCDVALTGFADCARLEAAIERWRRHPDVAVTIFLDGGDLIGRALANTLGAVRIAPRRATSADIVALGAPPVVAPADVPATIELPALIDTASETLIQLFATARRQDHIDPSILGLGADALLLAVKHNGIGAIIDTMRAHDDGTFQHCLLVAGLVTAFAARRGMSLKAQHLLARAGLIHDIGKARVPHAILNKPGALTPTEMGTMRRHPATGYYMIAHQAGFDPVILDIVRHHHEYIDGTGYPDGLRGEQISALCRLVTICDIFGALIERRPYKPPMMPWEAYGMLEAMGPKLDAGLVAEFAQVVEEMNRGRMAA